MRIKTGDTVKVLYGKYKGKTAKVVKILPKKDMVIVEGVNLATKHVKGDGRGKESAIVKIAKPLPVSKVQLVVDGKATRIKYETKEDKKIRVTVKGGKKIETTEVKKEAKKTEDKKETKKTTSKKSTKDSKEK